MEKDSSGSGKDDIVKLEKVKSKEDSERDEEGKGREGSD
jgi:hypothetical protein